MAREKALVFTEEQRFTQWYVWLVLVLLLCIPLGGIYMQLILGKPFGNNPMSDTGLLIFGGIMVAVMLFFMQLRLRTVIDASGVQVQLFPLVKKHFAWMDIQGAKTLRYGFVGGYGIRLLTPYGTVYNIKGKEGLALELKNGKKYLIGSQKTDEIELVLANFLEH